MNRRATSILLSIILLFGYVPENKPVVWFAAIPAISWGAAAIATLDVGAKFAAIYIVGKKIAQRRHPAEAIAEVAVERVVEAAAQHAQQAETAVAQQAISTVTQAVNPQVVAVLAAATDVAQTVVPKSNASLEGFVKLAQSQEAQKFLKEGLKNKKTRSFLGRMLPTKQVAKLVATSKPFIQIVGPYVPYVGTAFTLYGAYSNADTIREAATTFFSSGSSTVQKNEPLEKLKSNPTPQQDQQPGTPPQKPDDDDNKKTKLAAEAVISKKAGDEASDQIKKLKTSNQTQTTTDNSRFQPAKTVEAEKGQELFKFGNSAAEHMEEPHRVVPVQILKEVIENPLYVTKDPRGTNSLKYFARMWRDGKQYNIEVLYDKLTNTIDHFMYAEKKLGPLSKIGS